MGRMLENLVRLADTCYQPFSHLVFSLTQHDPEKAHRWIVKISQFLRSIPLDEAVPRSFSYRLSNAAGFNKNGDIPDVFLAACGFDRNVIGTVTKEPRTGNPKPRCWRFAKHRSLVNYLGLPGQGAAAISEHMRKQPKPVLPITLNVAALEQHPEKKTEEIRLIASQFTNVEGIDRIELNISCPNVTDAEKKMDMISCEVDAGISALRSVFGKSKELWLKVSPDMSEADYRVLSQYYVNREVHGFVLCNTSTARYLAGGVKLPDKGGISGEWVYSLSASVRQMFLKLGIPGTAIIACGGLSNAARIEQESTFDINEFQLYTALIYNGLYTAGRIKSKRDA